MKIISRSEWKARRPRGRTLLAPSRVKGLAAHYNGPGTSMPDTVAEGSAFMRATQNFHMDSRGWTDYAYNFGVDLAGNVYEGRGWGVRSAANGTNYGNSNYFAAFLMIGGDQKPSDPMLHSLLQLLAARPSSMGGRLLDHRTLKPTACAGEHVAKWIRSGAPDPGGIPVEPTAPIKLGDRAIGKGDSGSDVKEWQEEMLEIADDTKLDASTRGVITEPLQSSGGADGVFGSGTHETTRRFQSWSGTTADGIVGPATLERLASYKSGGLYRTKPRLDNVVVYDRSAHWIDSRLASTVGALQVWKVIPLSDVDEYDIGHAHVVGKAAQKASSVKSRDITILSGPTRQETKEEVLAWMSDNMPDMLRTQASEDEAATRSGVRSVPVQ